MGLAEEGRGTAAPFLCVDKADTEVEIGGGWLFAAPNEREERISASEKLDASHDTHEVREN